MFMPINEQLSFSVSFGGNVKASATATINDTSRPAYEYMLVGSNPSSTEITEIDIPTYALATNATSVNEGETVTFTLSTTMLDTGTIVPYTVTGISAADLSSGSLTGTFTTNASGTGTVSFTLANDNSSEGAETLTLTLNGKDISKSVTINDTSVLLPTYNVGWYDDPTGANAKLNTANEGDIIFLVVKTTNVPNGTGLTASLSGTGITVNDFSGNSLSDTIVINSNIGYMRCTLAADRVTEGNEMLTATITSGGTNVGVTGITINDTSLSTTYAFNVYDAVTNGNVVTEITVGPDVTVTPNGTYNFSSNLPELIIGPGATKFLTIDIASCVPYNSEWDGASGGPTGFYLGQAPTPDAYVSFYDPNGDRSGGYWNSTGSVVGWKWGNTVFPAVGETTTFDSIEVTFVSNTNSTTRRRPIAYGNPTWMPIYKIKVKNNKSTAVTLNTIFGQYATGGATGLDGSGDGSHGEQGGAKLHGVNDEWFSNRAYSTSDGSFKLSDS